MGCGASRVTTEVAEGHPGGPRQSTAGREPTRFDVTDPPPSVARLPVVAETNHELSPPPMIQSFPPPEAPVAERTSSASHSRSSPSTSSTSRRAQGFPTHMQNPLHPAAAYQHPPHQNPRASASGDVEPEMNISLQDSSTLSPLHVSKAMYQANSFAASKSSFRRQSFFMNGFPSTMGGGAGMPSAAAFAPRVRMHSTSVTRHNPIPGIVSRNSSFSSVTSDTTARNASATFVAPPQFYGFADIRSGRISREEPMGENFVRHTYFASEPTANMQKQYYVLKALQNTFCVTRTTCTEALPEDGGEVHVDRSMVSPERFRLLDGVPCFSDAAAVSMHTYMQQSEQQPSDPVFQLDPRVAVSFTLLQKMGHKNMQTVFSVISTPQHTAFLGEVYLSANIADDREIFDDAKICQLVKEVVRVLHYTHSHGIAHGHLSLANIHAKDGSAGFAVSDFGMAHLFAQLTCRQWYFAGYHDAALHPPERLQRELSQHFPGDQQQDQQPPLDVEAMDLWALGCCAYQKRFGAPPFQGSTVEALHHAILYAEPEFPPYCDVHLQLLLSRLLNKNPARRGPLFAVLRAPFIRKRVDVSARSVSSGASMLSTSVREMAGFLELGGIPTRRPSRAVSSSVTADSTSTSPAADETVTPPPFLLFDDVLLCSHCNVPMKVVCYQCAVCADFRVCKSCFYQSNFSHPPAHALHCHALDTTVVQGDASLADGAEQQTPTQQGLTRNRAHRGTIMIATSQLTEREATIFSMTGTLPPCLDLERSTLAITRDRRVSLDAAAALGSSVGVGVGGPPLDHSGTAESLGVGQTAALAAQQQSSAGASKPARQFMSEAAANAEETVDSIIESNIQCSGLDLLLSNLDLKEFPAAIVDPPLVHVTILDLANNQLRVIPDDIEYLVNLRRLLVGNNQLTNLPETIGNLTDLEMLDANHNQLATLPQSLMFCDQMDVLALDYNAFTEIPTVLADVEVRTVYLAANPGITQWPPRDTLESFPKGMSLGLDNDPGLFRDAATALAGLETHIHVVWNRIYPDHVSDVIFLGSLRSAQSDAVYRKLNIQYVLTMGRGLDALPPPGGKHKVVVVDDLPGASIDFAFEEAVEFIDEAARAGLGCLVHCFAGMSRSATTVIAYLMMKRGMRLDEAYCTTRRGRPAIYPNAGFFDQLIALDAKLFPGQRALDMPSMERDKVP